MKRATVYRRKGHFYVHASSQTTDGVWTLDQPCLAVAEAEGDAALAEAVRRALAGSRRGVAHPTTWTGVTAPLLSLAGVRTWATFAKNAECAGVEADRDGLRVVPTNNLGPRDGFEDVESEAKRLADSVTVELGATVRALTAPRPPR